MRITRALPLLIAAVSFAACGSSSTKKNPDAHVSGTPDAPIVVPDAPNNTNVTNDWNAAVCPPATACTSSADLCLQNQGAATGYCGTQCGPDTQSMTLDTTTKQTYANNCASSYKGTGGTPACLFYSGTGTNGDQPPFSWYCAVACGTLNGQSLGTCPTGLTCTNFSGQTYGACQP